MSCHPTSRLARSRLLLAVVLLASGWSLLAASTASAASGSFDVSLEISSMVSLQNNCTAPGAYQLGMVTSALPGLSATDADVCSFTFSSSNDKSMLRVYQRDQHDQAFVKRGGWASQVRTLHHFGVSAVSSTVAWFVGNGGGHHVTTDGGVTWTKPSGVPSTGYAMRAVDGFGAADAWFAGGGGTVIKYEAGAWSSYGSAQTGVSGTFYGIDAVDMNVMYGVGANGSVTTTRDGGASWTPFVNLHGVTDVFYDVAAIGTNTACAVGGGGRVMRTTDGGDSWVAMASAGQSLFSVTLAPGTTNVLWAVGNHGSIYKSTDTCATWTLQSSPVSVYSITAVTAVSSTEAYAVSGDGVALATTDGGTTWVAKRTPLANWEGIDVHPASGKMYAVGSGRSVAYSSDGADTWTPATVAGHVVNAPTLKGVVAWDAATAVSVGGSGLVLRTIDAGSTWLAQTSGTSEHLRGVTRSGASDVYAAGDEGTVIASDDGGVTWASRTSGTTQRLRGISAADSRVVAVGDNGTVVTSADGVTWTTGSSGTTAHLYGVSMASASVGWAVGLGGVLLKTTDGGETWSSVASGTGHNLLGVDAVSETVAWAVGYNRTLRTTDGSTWTIVNNGGSSNHYIVDAESADRAVIGASDSRVATTTDGGTTWSGTNSTLVGSGVYGLDEIDENTIFAIGSGRTITGPVVADKVPDYALGVNSWGVADTSLFGACLQAVGATTAADWQVDAGGTAGLCEANDSDPWNGIGMTAAPIARTTAAGATGRADIVFGLRVSTTQSLGSYSAPLVFEVVAPAL